jgi:hypothetical protein
MTNSRLQPVATGLFAVEPSLKTAATATATEHGLGQLQPTVWLQLVPVPVQLQFFSGCNN